MKKYASLNVTVKSVDESKHQIRAVFSTGTEDRHGEIVVQSGWKLAEYLTNPVVLWSHDNYSPAIGKVVDIAIIDGNLEGTIQFAAEEYAFAELIYNLMKGGYINAISVGFSNDKWQYDEANDQMLLIENTLYEVSVVNVPANALALAKSKGVDISLIEKRTARAETITKNILKNEDTEVATVKPTAEGDEEEADDADEKAEDTPAPTPAPIPDEQTPAEKAKQALEILIKSDNGTIEAAVRDLTGHLDAAKSNQRGSSVGAPKKYPVKHINRIIKRLHKGKV